MRMAGGPRLPSRLKFATSVVANVNLDLGPPGEPAPARCRRGDYSTMVVDGYVGTGAEAGLGVREAFLLAGERAASAADHG